MPVHGEQSVTSFVEFDRYRYTAVEILVLNNEDVTIVKLLYCVTVMALWCIVFIVIICTNSDEIKYMFKNRVDKLLILLQDYAFNSSLTCTKYPCQLFALKYMCSVLYSRAAIFA